MAGINITKSEFEDIICLYILDKLLKPNTINPAFTNIMKKMKELGMQSFLYNYFQKVPSETRVNYKRFMDSFKKDQTALFINEEDLQELTEFIVKKTLDKDNINIKKLELLHEIVSNEIKGE